ncbi:shikimate dehydrogenase [Rothia sp. ZJ1223]|uniref:shikimate dehydrogenase n=1 Tax=Rothia sp. ZJ1223 TaxID=2811098 RepID=UPI00195CC580|nr:shikimate dehydrogenase [Rothia sp. ZJ1223]MBM7051746.1 shikimate dehydrogenase [Rothia sp. ZJ1223]
MSLRNESYLVGLIGDGITASLTPPMHEAEATHHGLHYLYRPIDLHALELHGDSLPALLDAAHLLGFNAFNITHPCKQSVLDYLDTISPEAVALGAVNTVLINTDGTRHGENTDYSGFLTGMKWGLPKVTAASGHLHTVVQLGSGGAGSATAYALLKAGVRVLHLVDPDAAKATEKALDLQALFPQAQVIATAPQQLANVLPQAQGLVNASPIGMHVHPGAPLDLSLLHANLWVADVIYLPQETPLIVAARQLGCHVLPGGYMAVGQAVDALALIADITPNAHRMREHFATLVGSPIENAI